MSDNNASVHDFLRGRLAAAACVAPIVECIRKMRLEGLANDEIAGLLRHAAGNLDEAATRKNGKFNPAA